MTPRTNRSPVLVPALALASTLAALTLPRTASADDSLRCPGGLVSVGDAGVDLLARCGPPALRERRVDDRWATAGNADHPGKTAVSREVSVVIDEWSYDFGPNAFSYVARLENGRVVAFVRGSYGHRQDPPAERVAPPRARCDENAVHEGDAKLDVLSRCGEPAAIDAWDETASVVTADRKGEASGASTTTRVERWTYDHGRNRFLRFVRFENGRVVKVSTGGYGYAD